MPTTPPNPPAPPEYFEQPPSPPTPPPRKKLSRKASILGAVIALAVAAGLAWLAWDLTRPADTATAQRGGAPGAGGPGGGGGPGGAGGGARRGVATTVGFAVAESATIPVNLDALGTVVPQATVRVRPQVSGVLQQVVFQEGQNVKRGTLLATIDPRPFEMALQQSLGARMRDEAQLAAARVTLTRFETLLQQDSIARQEVDTQRATVRQLEAAVVSSKANEGTARLNLSYTRIVAPIDGRLGLREVDIGNTVGPGDTNGVAVITKLSPIDVEFAVPQDHASWLQNNAGAAMEVKAFDRTRTTLLDTGSFASLDNQIDTQTGTVRAKARFSNARQQLFPSQFVNVQLQLRVIQDAVVIPVTAMRQGGSGDYVFVLMDDRTVKIRPVVRGQPVGDRIQVTSGLQLGERVITEGADRLREGARVVLPGDAPRQPGAGGQGGQRRRGGGPQDGAPGPRAAASGALPAASAPFTGASAARGPAPSPSVEGLGRGRPERLGATAPSTPASAMIGTGPRGAGRLERLTPEERAQLTPEQRQERRRLRQEARQAEGAAQ